MKKILAVLCLCLSTAAVAGQTLIDTSKLSEEQINELKIQALKMQNRAEQPGTVIDTAAKVSSTARTEAEKWADFGKNLGSAMVATAKELGVAVNEFSQTGIGKITTGLIVYKLVGRDILHIVVGMTLLFFLPWLIVKAREYVMRESIKYEYQDRKFLFVNWKKRVIVEERRMDGSDAFWVFFWTCALTVISVLISVWIALS